MRPRLTAALLVVFALSCGRGATQPSVPDTSVEHATVNGTVVDSSNIPLAGIQVQVAESDDSFVTASDGRYSLQVPADSTVTLRAFPLDVNSVYKPTTLTPFSVAARTQIDDLDIWVLPGSTLGAFNAIAGPDEERGVLAITVVSLRGGCEPSGATVSVDPVPNAVPVYVPEGASQPDRTLTAMQPNARPDAWVVGVPPGTGYSVKLASPSCTQLPFPVAYNKMSWLPGLRVSAKNLTQVPMFTP